MDRKQPPADEIGLGRLAQPQCDIGLAHGEVQFVIGQDHDQFDIGIKLAEFRQARRQPGGAEAGIGGDFQQAMRLFTRIGQAQAGALQPHQHLLHRAKKHFALLGQQKPARMTMKQRSLEVIFQRRDLAADRRLAQVQRLTGMGEGPGGGRGVKNAQLVPVHPAPAPMPTPVYNV